MPKVAVSGGQKGAIGGDTRCRPETSSRPVSTELAEFVCREYGLDLNTELSFECRRGIYFNASVDGDAIAWKADG
jgi:hypothetical protein